MRPAQLEHKRKQRKYAVQWLIFGLATILAFWLVMDGARMEKPKSQNVEFDHSGCQYPDRLSNPPAGCDNSDPPCGEVAKGAAECPVGQGI
jgi:hypothetical protein